MTVDDIRKALADRNLKKVAEKANLHYNTVILFARGETKKPSYETVTKLIQYLEGK